MANKKKGFIPLWRDIKSNWIWQDKEPFDKRSAWIDLLLSVNHEKKKIFISNRVQVIEPGQMWTSYLKLAERWHWSKKRVMRYLSILKSDGMIDIFSTTNGTMITLVNYDNYALQGNTNDTALDTTVNTAGDTPHDTALDTQTRTNKNYKNIENVDIKNPAVCPGRGWYWHEPKQKWVAPPKGGGEWE